MVGQKRDNKEQYYTLNSVAKDCVQTVFGLYNLSDFDLIVEPSAGTGIFLNSLKEYKVSKILAYDIEPKGEEIVKMNFLTLDTSHFSKNCLVIGNPPFGRQASLAKQFIKKCCLFSSVIAFILPKSFKKQSMYSSFDPYFHQVYSKDLENKSFLYDNQEYSVPCVFQIWEKKNHKREKKEREKETKDYSFVRKNEAHLAFRRVGGKAGNFIFKGLENLSDQSHYFIKVNSDISSCEEKLKDNVKTIKWEENNTTGPKSISKQELITNLNQLFDNLRIT